MFVIEKVRIEGLWDHKSIEFICDKNFNFLIGENGTGKTTIINLIAAVLLVDFEKLDKIPFKEVSIYLRKDKKKKKPSGTVV